MATRNITLEVSIIANVELTNVPDDVFETLQNALHEKGSVATGDIPDEIYDRFESALASAVEQAQDDAEIVDIT